ncbi:Hypothetical protein A7982_04247 [Minicystis rosea]|nr:Hypothetical protein A7982_04247 [Minicystis rosea]
MSDISRSWTIAEWDVVKARGVIACGALGRLTFDASAALVDELRVGEVVHVELQRDGSSFRVVKIWPDDPRVRAPDSAPSAPPLRSDRAAALEHTLSALPLCIDYRVLSFRDDLLVEGDDAAFEYGSAQTITFRGVEYLELPTRRSGKIFRLAEAEERRYIGAKVDLSAESVVVKIVDDALHAFFVVCEDIDIASGRRH